MEKDQVISRLQSASAADRFEALEILVERFPDHLAEELPRFLVSEDPRMRILAIRGLAQVDREEALLHLESMLVTGSPTERKAAFQMAFQLPFSEIKPILLKFLAVENDPEMLGNAGVLFKINPDIEVPFRLWELAEISPRQKLPILDQIIKGACQAIFASGQFEDGGREYSSRLREWTQKRAALRFVQRQIDQASAGEDSWDQEIQAALKREDRRPHLRWALESALEWPIPEAVKGIIRKQLEIGETGDSGRAGGPEGGREGQSPAETKESPVRQSSAAPPTSVESSPQEQLRMLAGLDQERGNEAKPMLEHLLSGKEVQEDILAGALRAGFHFQLTGFQETAKAALKHPNTSVVSAALEYLSFADKDLVFPLLGQFLKSTNPRVKTTALRILQSADPPRALSVLKMMLRSTITAERQAAMSSLVHFDFSLIRDDLCDLAAAGADTDLLKPLLCLFEANIANDHLYPLFRFGKMVSAEQARLVQDTLSRGVRILEKLNRLPKGEFESRRKSFEERFRSESEKSAKPPKPYALKVTRPISAPSQLEESVEKAAGFVARYWWQAAAGAGVVVVIFLMSLVPASRLITGVEINKVIPVKGTIKDIVPRRNEWRLETKDGKVYLLPLDAVPSKKIRIGKKVACKLLPTFVSREGHITAKLKSSVKEYLNE